jgi:hypothetical protein
MEIMWKHFFVYGNTISLAIATIVNEQSYLESRLIQNQMYKKVIHSFTFHAQELLKLNHILFPLYSVSPKIKPTLFAGHWTILLL